MSEGTRAQRIAALLAQQPGLDDDQIAQLLGIARRQAVNQICRRLADKNLLTRERGTSGKIVNRLIGAELPAAIPRIAAREKGSVGMRRSFEGASLVPRDLAKTLIVIPCSGSKQNTYSIGEQGRRIVDSLPEALAGELEQARAHVKDAAGVDETTLVPAWKRYNGFLYERGRVAIGDLMSAGAHVAIVSGGYGVVLATEPIGIYDAAYIPSWWPNLFVARVLLSYAARHGLRSVRAFASVSGNYRKALDRVPWAEAGVDDPMLLTPQPGPANRRRSPEAIGEALCALRDGALTNEWRSSYSLALQSR